MPEISVELKVIVTLDLPKNRAGLVTNEDVEDMARSVTHFATGIQYHAAHQNGMVTDGSPDLIDCWGEVDICTDPEITDIDDGFDLIHT